jgi:ribosomal protein S27E
MTMRRLYDVRCSDCLDVTEAFGYSNDIFRCGTCGGEAKRIISPVRCKLEGVSGDFPGEAMKWVKRHERAARNGDNG